MQTVSRRWPLVGICVMASTLFFGLGLACAQDTPRPAPGVLSADTAAAVAALADSLRDLQAQIQTLYSQLDELRAEQSRSSVEVSELRRELDAAKAQLSLRSLAPGEPPFSPSGELTAKEAPPSSSLAAAPQPIASEQASPDRVSQLEENLQLTEAKLGDQYQTKIESGSKYRVRLSGLVLLNMFENRGLADNMDVPQVALPRGLLDSSGSFGGTLRQSQIGLEVFGPDIEGAHTSANVKFDFAGGFPYQPNGVAEGLVRLRIGTVRIDWKNTSIVAGQDTLFFAPLAPTSLASVSYPPLSYAGNLWAWTPQVRIEHRVTLSEDSSIQLQGGILDGLSGDYPSQDATNYGRYPSWGEMSSQPAYAARVAWSHSLFGQDLIVGAGGYYDRQFWGLGRNVDAWASTVDLTVPLGKYLGLTGAFYRGRAVNGLGGGIGQGVLINGSFVDPNTAVRGLNSMGGWAQLKIKPTTRFEINAALGIDNPFASDIRKYGGSQSYLGPWLSRNVSPFVNFIYQVRSNVLFSLEYRRLQTYTLDSTANSANHVNASVGYIF